MIKRTPARPIAGGTNEGKRPLRFTYWRTGYSLPPPVPLDFFVAQAGEYHCKPGYRTGNFELGHQTQFLYQLGGSATLVYEQAKNSVQAGDMIIIPPHATFAYSGEPEIKFHWLGLEGNWPAVLGQPTLRHLSVGQDTELEDYFVEIREVLILRKPGHALRAIGVLYELIARLEEISTPTPAPESAYPETVRNAMIFLRENYAQPFDAATTAAAVGVSPSHLRALFEKWVGESPKRFHTRCRINQARRLLTEQSLSVFEAGYHVGFDDVHHFSRVFKQITGMAPRRYAEISEATTSRSPQNTNSPNQYSNDHENLTGGE